MSDNFLWIAKLYDISDVVLIKTCKNRNFQCAFKLLVQQLVKGMCWTVPVQNFPRAIVEHRLHTLDLPPRDVLELGAGGKKLPQQAVRVLVRAPLPGTLGMGEVDLHLGLFGEQPMFPHLLPLVVREGAAELGRQRPDFPREGPPHRGCVFGRQGDQQCKSGGAFHQRAERRRVRMANQQVALPMAGHRAIRHLGRPLVDAHKVLNGPRREAELAGTARAVPSAQIAGEFALQRSAGQHIQIGVDGFVRDAHSEIIRIPLEQAVGNLVRRPALSEQRQHGAAKSAMDRELAGFPWTMGPPVGALMGWDRPIGDGTGAVPSKFPRDRTRRALQRLRRGPQAIPGSQQTTEFFSFHESQTLVEGHVQLLGSWNLQDTGVALEP